MLKREVPFIKRPEYITVTKTHKNGYDIWEITTDKEVWSEWETFLEKHDIAFGKPI